MKLYAPTKTKLRSIIERFDGRYKFINRWVIMRQYTIECLDIPRVQFDYNGYLLSDEWKLKRTFFLMHIGCCENCGQMDCLELHHRNYNHLFCELFDDLELLCLECHQQITADMRCSEHIELMEHLKKIYHK